VYFKDFDVNDPFDQINNDMPNVGLIGSNMAGPDNRPGSEGPWGFTETTDAQSGTVQGVPTFSPYRDRFTSHHRLIRPVTRYGQLDNFDQLL